MSYLWNRLCLSFHFSLNGAARLNPLVAYFYSGDSCNTHEHIWMAALTFSVKMLNHETSCEEEATRPIPNSFHGGHPSAFTKFSYFHCDMRRNSYWSVLKRKQSWTPEWQNVVFIVQCGLLIPCESRSNAGSTPFPATVWEGTWDLSEAQAEFIRGTDFLITPMLSLIFQISSKSKYQNIFVLMRNPTAPGGKTLSGEKSRLEVFSWK